MQALAQQKTVQAQTVVAPALAMGNSVVLKPDEHAPLLALELAREFEAAGLPPGVLNVVTGDGEPVGFAFASLDEDPTWGTLLDNLHLLPSHQGTGIGRGLLAAVAHVALMVVG